MKILGSTESTIQPGKGGARVNNESKAKRNNRYKLDSGEIDSNEIDSNEIKNDKVEKNDQKTSKSKKLFKFKKTELSFFIFKARLAFTKLRQLFVKVLIFYQFDLECYI